MPKSGVLLLLILVAAVGVVLGRSGPEPQSAVRSPIESHPVAAADVTESEVPVLQFGEQGWLERTLTVATNVPATGPIEVVVELRFTWSGGAGHVRVVGWETAGRYEEVITDEHRLGDELDASLGHYQRMFDELRAAGGSVEVADGVTVARQRILTPDGEAQDVWRMGIGAPEW